LELASRLLASELKVEVGVFEVGVLEHSVAAGRIVVGRAHCFGVCCDLCLTARGVVWSGRVALLRRGRRRGSDSVQGATYRL
jgi:hypothetical protein